MKKIIAGLIIVLTGLMLVSCERDAEVASRNLSYEADQFRVFRRVIFYNGVTDVYMLSIEGFCSINKDNQDNQLEVTCKDDVGQYKKHFLGLSDNTTYFVEQLDGKVVSDRHYKVIFKPSTIVPSVEFK
jgi:hypothetical protein